MTCRYLGGAVFPDYEWEVVLLNSYSRHDIIFLNPSFKHLIFCLPFIPNTSCSECLKSFFIYFSVVRTPLLYLPSAFLHILSLPISRMFFLLSVGLCSKSSHPEALSDGIWSQGDKLFTLSNCSASELGLFFSSYHNLED